MENAKRTDIRLRIMNEILLGIQVIKMYAWEKSFAKLVDQIRKWVKWIALLCTELNKDLFLLISFDKFLLKNNWMQAGNENHPCTRLHLVTYLFDENNFECVAVLEFKRIYLLWKCDCRPKSVYRFILLQCVKQNRRYLLASFTNIRVSWNSTFFAKYASKNVFFFQIRLHVFQSWNARIDKAAARISPKTRKFE